MRIQFMVAHSWAIACIGMYYDRKERQLNFCVPFFRIRIHIRPRPKATK